MPGGMSGNTRHTSQCSGLCNNPLPLELGLQAGPGIRVHIWQSTSCPAVTLPKAWSAQNKAGLSEAGLVRRSRVPVPQLPRTGCRQGFSTHFLQTAFQLSVLPTRCSGLMSQSVPLPVLRLSLPVAHPLPCTDSPLFGLALLPFSGVCPLCPHCPVSSFPVSPSPVSDFLQLFFSLCFQPFCHPLCFHICLFSFLTI